MKDGEVISGDSKFYVKRVTQDIVSKTDNLNNFPEIGRIVPELDDSTVRELIIYSFRLIYEVKPDRVVVLAIIHGKRDFMKTFNK